VRNAFKMFGLQLDNRVPFIILTKQIPVTMKKLILYDFVKGMLLVPIALTILLAPYSIVVGWNLVSAFLFWFILVPVVVVYVPGFVSKNKNHWLEAISGLVVFYGLMVFMIYSHYQSDLFKIMMWSAAINVVITSLLFFLRKPKDPYTPLRTTAQ